MSDTTTYPAANPNYPHGGIGVNMPNPAPPPAPKAPDIKERASGLLAVMTDAQRHNAPITPWMLTELGAVVAQVTGQKAAAPLHLIMDARGLPDDIIFKKPDSGIVLLNSAEEALAYVRSLPKDVQARPAWVAADNALVEAVASVPGSDVSPAIRLFEAALAEDRKLDAKPVTIADKPKEATIAPASTVSATPVTPDAPKAPGQATVQPLSPGDTAKPAPVPAV